MFPEIEKDPTTGKKKMQVNDFYNFLQMHGENEKVEALEAEEQKKNSLSIE
jgi:hypothetical protein